MIEDNIKKNNELVWAAVFIDWLNNEHKSDYKIEPELGENSPVDMHAISKTGRFPHLDLQLTYAIELPFVALETGLGSDLTGQPTIDAIERKYQKFLEQGTDMTQIVLVIQGYMKKSIANKVFNDSHFTKFKQYPFKGIYYASPPMIAEETGEHLQMGYVKPIKDIF